MVPYSRVSESSLEEKIEHRVINETGKAYVADDLGHYYSVGQFKSCRTGGNCDLSGHVLVPTNANEKIAPETQERALNTGSRTETSFFRQKILSFESINQFFPFNQRCSKTPFQHHRQTMSALRVAQSFVSQIPQRTWAT